MKMKQLLFVLLAFFALVTTAFAQETTSTIGGTVNDDKGNPVAGATVTAIHEPTGAVSTTQSNKKGIFNDIICE